MSTCLQFIDSNKIDFVFGFLFSKQEWIDELFGYDLILVKDAKERGARALIPWVEIMSRADKERLIFDFLYRWSSEYEDNSKEFEQYFEYCQTQVTL